MAVEDVNNPKTVAKVDPRAIKEKGEDSVAYWEGKAASAKARLDYQDYTNAMQQLGRTPDPAFQIKGSINLGDINPQEQARQAQDKADKLVVDKDKQIKDANEKAAEAENKLHQEKIEGIRQDFTHQMDMLRQTIEKVTTAKDERPLHEQFKELHTSLLDLAKDLGLEKAAGGRDPMVDIKLAEMNYENAMKEREFQLRMRNDDRQWQLDIQRLQQDREIREKELSQQSKRDDMLFTAPQTIGAAIAKGLAENATKGGGAPPGGVSQDQPSGPQTYKMRAAPGEFGEVDCPVCNSQGIPTKIGIGPTSALVTCVKCNSRFDIERVPATKTPVAEEEETE